MGLDKDHKIKIFNKSAESTTGYTKAEVVGKDWFKIFFPKEMLNEMNKASKDSWGITSHSYVNPILSKEGKEIIVSWQTTGMYESEDASKYLLLSIGEVITKQKNIEEALKRSEYVLNETQKISKIGGWEYDVESGATYFSDEIFNIHGISKDKVLNPEEGMKFYHPDDRPLVSDAFAKVISDGVSYDIEVRFINAQGKNLWVRTAGKPIYKNGKIAKILGTLLDITDRKLSEAQLIESNKRYKAFISVSNTGAWEYNTETDFLWCSPEYFSMLGKDRNQFNQSGGSNLNETWIDLLHPEDSERASTQFADYLKNGSVGMYENYFRMQHSDGYWVWILSRGSTLHDENGNITNLTVGTHIDITQRKIAEEKLSSIIKVAPTGIGFVINRVIHEVNDVFCDMTGYSREELIGEDAIIVYPSKDDYEYVGKHKYEQIQKKRTGTVETKLKQKDGQTIDVILSSTPIDVNDLSSGIIFTALDITERKKAEEDLKSALEKAQESDHLKSAFLANMSHEIRTPMNGILGFTELLKEPQLTGNEQNRYIKIIEKSGDRMLNTINDIIDISKIEAGQVEVLKSKVSVNKILEEQYEFFNSEAQSKGLELIYKPTLSEREVIIVTDKLKLEGILINLIKNAIKFTKHGNISFGYSLKKERDFKKLEFYVKDTGVGIPSDRIEAIFNRFEQADIEDSKVFEGSGLGLAISKSYVEMLGGNIQVSSIEGSGSTFTFSIPYIQQSTKYSSIKNTKKKEQKTSLTDVSVIIAEDDETSQLFFKTIFKNKFRNIIYTTNGAETIKAIKKHPEINIILMDIKLPGMNGYDATFEIRKFNRDVVIIAQTAFGLSGDKEKAIEAGCDDYISKPINKKLLFEKIMIHLSKKSI